MNILNLYEYVHSNVEIQIHSFLPYKTWVGFPSSHRAGTLEPGGTEHLCSSRAVLSERSCVGSRGREKWSRWKQRTDNDYRSKARFWLLIPRERADGEIPESQGFSCLCVPQWVFCLSWIFITQTFSMFSQCEFLELSLLLCMYVWKALFKLSFSWSKFSSCSGEQRARRGSEGNTTSPSGKTSL